MNMDSKHWLRIFLPLLKIEPFAYSAGNTVAFVVLCCILTVKKGRK